MPHATRAPPDSMGTRRGRVAPSFDAAVAELARRQHGVVATRQLVGLGITKQAVSLRARAGRLHRLHRGVYAVGHTVLTVRGHWMAAVLAAGDGAALSFASAAAHSDLRTGVPATVDVSVPGAGGRQRRPGLRIHSAATLRADEVTTEKDGIPATTPARTILDMAAVLTPTRLENLLDRAERQELTDYPALDAVACAHAGSWRFHKTRRDFERDRARDAILAAAGYRTLRFTDRQIAGRPATVIAAIRAATARPGGAP